MQLGQDASRSQSDFILPVTPLQPTHPIEFEMHANRVCVKIDPLE